MGTTTSSLSTWLHSARAILAAGSSSEDDAPLEAALIAAHILGVSRTWVAAHPETILNTRHIEIMNSLVARLAQGEPLAYIIGRREFYGLEFMVTPSVLVPRPETEILVELALDWLQNHPAQRRVADIGCGSGCIGVTLARHVANLQVTAIDISPAALDVARQNAHTHSVAERINFVEADLLTGIRTRFDLVCANLPYIPSGDLDHLTVAQHEPGLALDGGEDGLRPIHRLLSQLPEHLEPGGKALLEIEHRQGGNALKVAREFFPRAGLIIKQDLAGLDRILSIQI
jgi:release factor glutamine methyltransferase